MARKKKTATSQPVTLAEPSTPSSDPPTEPQSPLNADRDVESVAEVMNEVVDEPLTIPSTPTRVISSKLTSLVASLQSRCTPISFELPSMSNTNNLVQLTSTSVASSKVETIKPAVASLQPPPTPKPSSPFTLLIVVMSNATLAHESEYEALMRARMQHYKAQYHNLDYVFLKSTWYLREQFIIDGDVMTVRCSPLAIPGYLHKTIGAIKLFSDKYDYTMRIGLQDVVLVDRMMDWLAQSPRSQYFAGDPHPPNSKTPVYGSYFVMSKDVACHLEHYLDNQFTFIQKKGGINKHADNVFIGLMVTQSMKVPYQILPHYWVRTWRDSINIANVLDNKSDVCCVKVQLMDGHKPYPGEVTIQQKIHETIIRMDDLITVRMAQQGA